VWYLYFHKYCWWDVVTKAGVVEWEESDEHGSEDQSELCWLEDKKSLGKCLALCAPADNNEMVTSLRVRFLSMRMTGKKSYIETHPHNCKHRPLVTVWVRTFGWNEDGWNNNNNIPSSGKTLYHDIDSNKCLVVNILSSLCLNQCYLYAKCLQIVSFEHLRCTFDRSDVLLVMSRNHSFADGLIAHVDGSICSITWSRQELVHSCHTSIVTSSLRSNS
jgi:hypothetical protein